MSLNLHNIAYIANVNMAVTVAQSFLFIRMVKWIKRGKNHYKHEHVESCS